MQNFRSTLIPTIAIPVSLIGTFVFMAAFDKLSNGYAKSVQTLSKVWVLVALALVLFQSRRPGFVPAEDQGYVMVLVKLPSGVTIQRTEAVANQAGEIVMSPPGVANVLAVPGLDPIDPIQHYAVS